MGKSLEMSSRGIGFERFMEALVKVPKQAVDKMLSKKGKGRKQATPKVAGGHD